MNLSNKVAVTFGLVVLLGATPRVAFSEDFDTARIQSLSGMSGVYDKTEQTFRVSHVRKDVTIAIEGDVIPPAFSEATWATFKTGRRSAMMMMGDFAVLPDEANPVMSVFLEAGMDVTALHDHFAYEEPRMFYIHFSGEGSLDKLASTLKEALALVDKIRTNSPMQVDGFGMGRLPPKSSITPEAAEAIFAKPGARGADGTLKFSFGGTATMSCGCVVGSTMGISTLADFVGSDDNAVVFGDFFVHENELTPVLKDLRRNGIFIVGVHSHMINETPRILFFHYWGRGPVAKLAQILKHAFEVQKQAGVVSPEICPLHNGAKSG
jgi:hypothetical protein